MAENTSLWLLDLVLEKRTGWGNRGMMAEESTFLPEAARCADPHSAVKLGKGCGENVNQSLSKDCQQRNKIGKTTRGAGGRRCPEGAEADTHDRRKEAANPGTINWSRKNKPISNANIESNADHWWSSEARPITKEKTFARRGSKPFRSLSVFSTKALHQPVYTKCKPEAPPARIQILHALWINTKQYKGPGVNGLNFHEMVCPI